VKGYFSQLWNDPEFFTNSMRSLIVMAGMAGATVIGMPTGRSLAEKIIVGLIAAVAGGTAAAPSAKKD
jgi:hypothetical protein